MPCWRCTSSAVDQHEFCPVCGSIQPPSPQRTHFERLGVPHGFAQDTDALLKRHREEQRRFHPDRFVTKSDTERRLSLEHATALNDAYRVLKDPCARAEYMLKLSGCDVTGDDKQVSLSPMFLMEVMELREVIDELRGSDTHVERGQIERDVALKYESILAELGAGLDGDDPPIAHMAQLAAQLRYLKRILEDLHSLAEGT